MVDPAQRLFDFFQLPWAKAKQYKENGTHKGVIPHKKSEEKNADLFCIFLPKKSKVFINFVTNPFFSFLFCAVSYYFFN